MELKDTIKLMESADYKERFQAEYFQVRIRIYKLLVMLIKWERGELDFKPICPKEILERQLDMMDKYMRILEERAIIEGVNIEWQEIL